MHLNYISEGLGIVVSLIIIGGLLWKILKSIEVMSAVPKRLEKIEIALNLNVKANEDFKGDVEIHISNQKIFNAKIESKVDVLTRLMKKGLSQN